MYLCLWSKARALSAQRHHIFCLWENELSRLLLQKDQQKVQMVPQTELRIWAVDWRSGSCVVLVLSFITSPHWWPQTKHLNSISLFLHLKSEVILAAYLTSKGYVRISQLKVVKCLEINGENNLYEYQVLLSFPSVFRLSLSLIGLCPGTLSEHDSRFCCCRKWPSPIIKWFVWNGSFIYGQGEVSKPNNPRLDCQWVTPGKCSFGFIFRIL